MHAVRRLKEVISALFVQPGFSEMRWLKRWDGRHSHRMKQDSALHLGVQLYIWRHNLCSSNLFERHTCRLHQICKNVSRNVHRIRSEFSRKSGLTFDHSGLARHRTLCRFRGSRENSKVGNKSCNKHFYFIFEQTVA